MSGERLRRQKASRRQRQADCQSAAGYHPAPQCFQVLGPRFLENLGARQAHECPHHEIRREIWLRYDRNALFIRTADAVHLATAHEIGERDVWTNDRHMLAAAAYFGLTGRSV
jgi:hypothetical protein